MDTADINHIIFLFCLDIILYAIINSGSKKDKSLSTGCAADLDNRGGPSPFCVLGH